MDYKNMLDYTGQGVLITGGTGNMGAEFARAYAAYGANVVIADIQEKGADAIIAECEQGGGKAYFVKVDLCDLASIGGMVAESIRKLGKIDVFCNHAGINIRKPALECTEEDWDKVIDTNLKASFFAAQAVGRHMVENRSGRILNMISDSCERGHKNLVLYASSKGGVRMMTKVLAHEWAEFGVTVNGIAPGYVKTQFTERLWSDPETLNKILDKIPMRRFATPADVAALMLYIASPMSSYLTGQTIFLEGGMHID